MPPSELLRPPGHRGPVIAAGAVLLALGLGLYEFRFIDRSTAFVHLLILAAAAALIGGLGLQYRLEGGRPLASASVLMVTGLLLALSALARLADVLGADGPASGTIVWVGILFCGLALVPAVWRNSAACALLAAAGGVGVLLAGWDWIFDVESATPFRWLLLLSALVLAAVSLVLRAGRPRHSTQMVNVAGLSIAAIGVIAVVPLLFGGFLGEFEPEPLLPGFWELVLVTGGCGLLAYGAVDREPGPVLIGLLCFAGFALVTTLASEETLLWWPLVLLLLGGGLLALGLRPRLPLPAEPSIGSVPLAARSEPVIQVRDDSPPS